MRSAALALVLGLALAGCKREPTFDERFGKAEGHIRAKAAAIDAQLTEQESSGELPAAAATPAHARPAT